MHDPNHEENPAATEQEVGAVEMFIDKYFISPYPHNNLGALWEVAVVHKRDIKM